MPVAPTCVDSLLELCRKSGVVEESALKQLLQTTRLPNDPVKAAAILVGTGLVTKFQVTQLLTGRHRGFRVGQYKILDRLGRGNNGSVFLCEQAVLRRKVALKLLPEQHAKDPGTRERFYRSARAAALLDHPHIVRIHDVNAADDVHYLAMEYLEGPDLQSVLDQSGPLPPERAVDYAIQAAAGLQHAHLKGLVHRDVKPANLLLGQDGKVKLVDLGLARCFLDPRDDLTQQYQLGKVLGTVDYLAPELAIASKSVDHRADIYSLGATLYALIAGRTPFEGKVMQKLLMVQLHVPPALAQLRPQVLGNLSAIVAKMMAKDPAARFQSAAEVIDALVPFALTQEDRAKASTVITLKTATVAPWAPAPSPSPTARVPAPAPTTRTAVTAKTKAASAVARQAGVSQPKRRKREGWQIIGGCVLGCLVIAGLVLMVTSAQHRPSPGSNSALASAGLHPPVKDETAAPASQPKPAKDGKVLYQFAAAYHRPFCERRHGKDTVEKTGEGQTPPGWSVSCLRDAVGDFMIENVAGRTGFGLRYVAGPAENQITTSFENLLPSLPTGGNYLVRFRYFAEAVGRGAAAVRVKGYRPIASADLRPTAGQWVWTEVDFTAVPELLDFFVNDRAPSANSRILISDLELVELSAPDPPGGRHPASTVTRSPGDKN